MFRIRISQVAYPLLHAAANPASPSPAPAPRVQLEAGEAIVNDDLIFQVMQYLMSLPERDRTEPQLKMISGVRWVPQVLLLYN